MPVLQRIKTKKTASLQFLNDVYLLISPFIFLKINKATPLNGALLLLVLVCWIWLGFCILFLLGFCWILYFVFVGFWYEIFVQFGEILA